MLFQWLDSLTEKSDNPLLTMLPVYLPLILAILLTGVLLKCLMHRLPADAGRAFAVNGEKSKGKPRGAGIIFILVFAVLGILFFVSDWENILYIVLIVAAMLTGYFDDASETPWNEYKKGLLDFLIAAGVTATYMVSHMNHADKCGASLPTFFGHAIPPVVVAILAMILIWVSINVVNCTDGVDGLCGSLAIVSLLAFVFFIDTRHEGNEPVLLISLFIACLIPYLWMNWKPSILLMGDAGSRAIGLFIAIIALKSESPFLFIPLCLVFILDGGLGLIKVSLKRFLKISIMKNIRTPLHDHARKKRGWSDVRTVLSFLAIQVVIALITIAVFL